MKCLRNCRKIGRITVVEFPHVGVRNRYRAFALHRKRKLFRDIRSSRRIPNSSKISSDSSGDTTGHSPSAYPVPSSICYSEDSNSLNLERLGSEDLMGLKVVDSDSMERREIASFCNLQPEDGGMESSTRGLGKKCHRDSAAVIMPSVGEIEEFFSAAEEIERKRFAEKYNFDVAKDFPLHGRYEWAKLN